MPSTDHAIRRHPSPHRPNAHGRRRLAALTALGLVLAACNPAPPSPSPAPPSTDAPTASVGPGESGTAADSTYARIRADVAAIRGLTPTADVDPVSIDEAELRTNLEAEFDAENTPQELAVAEDTLIALGFLAPGASLRALTLDFQSGQVAGYYSPERDELYVVRRGAALGPSDRVTYAHEFTHQLQDQHVDLGSLGISDAEQSDRSLGRLALIEGDASFAQQTWTQQNLTSEELGQLLAEALDPEALAALQRAPAFLRETALFPYQDGLAFVSRLIASGGGYPAVDAAYRDPPDSTEQILHPDKYLTREDPIAVAIPDGAAAALGAGWSVAGEDTLGELILRTWLTEGNVPLARARVATAGWGGDRLALLRGPDGETAVALVTVWDTAADATEFASAAEMALQGIERVGEVGHEAGTTIVTLALGPSAAALAAFLQR